jgi:hypothetical protein
MSIGNLRSKLPTDTFLSVIQLVTTDGKFSIRNSVVSSVVTDCITDEKFFELEKTGRLRGGFGGLFFPMDSKRQPVQ